MRRRLRYGGRAVQRIWITLLVTNSIKVGGLVIAVREVFHYTTPNPLVIGLCAFMMAGAQFSEDIIIELLARFFTAPLPKVPKEIKTPKEIKEPKP